jgi:hypothetical protein
MKREHGSEWTRGLTEMTREGRRKGGNDEKGAMWFGGCLLLEWLARYRRCGGQGAAMHTAHRPDP